MITAFMTLVGASLVKVGYGVAIFAICWLANFCVSLYKNIAIDKDNFEWKRLLNGVIKCLVVVAGTALLTIGIVCIFQYIAFCGIAIPSSLTGIDVITVVVIYASASIYYIKQTITTLIGCFKEEVGDIIDEMGNVEETNTTTVAEIDTPDVEIVNDSTEKKE